MEKRYIISGKSVDKVLRENRIRISRGELVVTPFEEAAPEVPVTTDEEPEEPETPKVPEVPVTDDKSVNADDDKTIETETDGKEAAPETDGKDVDPGTDSKEVPEAPEVPETPESVEEAPAKKKSGSKKK